MTSKPFIFGVAATGENFTDREKETTRLITNFNSGINTILISPRRIGKTSLVKKVCDITQCEKLKIVYLDIFACRDENEFYNHLASNVIKQTSSKWEDLMENIKTFLSHISPRFTFGPDPTSDFSFSFDFNYHDIDYNQILQLPEKIAQKKGYNIVICIDEFQQIGEFKNSVTFQKKLRSIWQLQKNVSYCLFGSKQHLMNEIFNKQSLPFYKFGDIINLQKIDTEHWIEYIKSRFNVSNKSISSELAAEICNRVDRHSSYVQQLAWLTLLQANQETTMQDIDIAHSELINQCAPIFESQVESLTSSQINFLRAMTDGVKTEFTKADVIKKYNLNTSANVITIRKSLIKKELIAYENKQVSFYDPVLAAWLKQKLAR